MNKLLLATLTFCALSTYAMASDARSHSTNSNSAYGGRQNTGHPQNDDRQGLKDTHASKPGIHVGADIFGIYLDKNSRNDNWREHSQMRRDAHERHFGDWYADPNRYRHYKKGHWKKDECFPVSRHAYDRHGRRVTNVAVMCYKRNGMTYIRSGSRHTYH